MGVDIIEKVLYIDVERTKVVNFIKLGGGDPLCTLHRVEGLYGWVRCRGNMRDSLLKMKSGRHQPHRPDCTGEGPSSSTLCSYCSTVLYG